MPSSGKVVSLSVAPLKRSLDMSVIAGEMLSDSPEGLTAD
ncbi:hypothetical protein ECL_00472 [Enterobacter cloacae subsp. cloacae ATCC 13047]|uniref:Uncharacterized protein n=1 Tax=Enterobacter cloacae subsp. cloacae (strain ATCC 13047 / DSM 30054 / NBRC 13535 / NCTC 10005 / WDCM 00083 / NCDC 279-56) TaxID=716541 RepID=A0A0H3CDY3_ENTCC|nr:hypothetical protein ECL_00472 [Enterobacter cloacae subsp. cloacae ATCC 13047]